MWDGDRDRQELQTMSRNLVALTTEFETRPDLHISLGGRHYECPRHMTSRYVLFRLHDRSLKHPFFPDPFRLLYVRRRYHFSCPSFDPVRIAEHGRFYFLYSVCFN